MGLLDDAIREHLELKRRRGADPGEVAREQREALAAVPREERADESGAVATTEDVTVEAAAHGDPEAVPSSADAATPVGDERLLGDSADAPTDAPGSGDSSAVIQETAELDMQTVLDGRDDETVAEAGVPLDEESLEWEVPGEAGAEPQAGVGPELHDAAGDVEEADPREDVLEETPAFLRDTPEQDRLWFEQRPPRDFDFDK